MWDGGIGRKKNRPIVATSLGNALEWFDISVYAHFAVYLSKAFFPASDQTTSLLLTFGTFGLTFLARPIGGALLGSRAGRYRRKASLLVSIVMMSAGTLAVALTPTFEHIGVLAPLLVITARLVQGFSAGGESEAPRPFWSSICRGGAALSRAGSSQAKALARFSAPAAARSCLRP